jgi:hypothetical protein
MPEAPEFDLQDAHRYYSVYCFNQAWGLINKPERTPQEDETMLQLAMASLWHWNQRVDCTPQNQSIGYWQISHIYSLLGQVENARHYGQMNLQVAQLPGVASFALGYAYESLARAESAAENKELMQQYLQAALQVAERMTDLEDKEQLLADLDTIH